jgi:threonine synthase
MQLTNTQRANLQEGGAAALFTSARTDPSEMAQAIRWGWEECGEMIDPHTACGLHAARAAGIEASIPVVTLATAHAAKFPDAVERATGQRPGLPTRVGDLFEREERCTELPGDYAAIADYVAACAVPKG